MRPAARNPLPAALAAAPREGRTCRPVHFLALPGVPRNRLSCCPLPREVPRETLLAEFQSAPQFEQVPLRRLMEEHRGSLRILLLADSGYYAAQAAVYLETLFRAREEGGASKAREADFWDSVDLGELEMQEDGDSPGARLGRSLAVVSPEALDPSLGRRDRQRPHAVHADKEEDFTLDRKSVV